MGMFRLVMLMLMLMLLPMVNEEWPGKGRQSRASAGLGYNNTWE